MIDWWPVDRLAELQAFIDEHWRRGHVLARDRELFLWQHRRRGRPERLSVLVAVESGRPVAMLGFVEFDVCFGGERARGGWMTTWLVVPEARGRGLGLAVVDRALGTEYELVGALGANAATRHILGAAGFAEVGMHRWVRVFDLDALRRLLRGRRVPPAAWAAWGEPSLPGEEELSPATPVGGCRDEAFVRWRYREHPRFHYRVLNGASGFAAYRLETVLGTDAVVMRIVDLLGGAELAEELVRTARRNRVVFADFSCTSTPFGLPLEQVGFAREDRLPAQLPGRLQPLDFSDRPLVSCFWAAPRLELDLGRSDLYVTRADSDLDRPT